MRVELPQILWYTDNGRIMSIDFYPNSNYLITCGAENSDKMWVKYWEIKTKSKQLESNPFSTANNIFMSDENSNTKLGPALIDDTNPDCSKDYIVRPEFLYELNGVHTSTVNIARFSPDGLFLATGGDDGYLIIWVQRLRPVEFGSSVEKIIWSNHTVLKGHLSDVYDLSWSSDSKYIISGSVDNHSIVWSIEKGKGVQKFQDHSGFVQGVSWDPKNKYLTTLSTDRTAKVYQNCKNKNDIKFFIKTQLKKISAHEIPENAMIIDSEPNNAQVKNTHYFADEYKCPSFVRRHGWSPDGSICLMTGGLDENDKHCVWVFSRKDMYTPIFMLPTYDSSPICVRFCPIFFKKQNIGCPMIELNYCMIFAVATINHIIIYSTDSIVPLFIVSNTHLQSITDLAWNGDSMLAAASADGYISFLIFEPNELGERENIDILPDTAKNSFSTYLNVDINNIYQCIYVKIAKPNIIKPIRKKLNEDENSNSNLIPNNDDVSNLIIEPNVIENKPEIEVKEETKENKGKRRIVPTMLYEK